MSRGKIIVFKNKSFAKALARKNPVFKNGKFIFKKLLDKWNKAWYNVGTVKENKLRHLNRGGKLWLS